MERQELERIMNRLEKEILPRFVSSLSSKKDELNNSGIKTFGAYAYDLYMSTRQAFLEMLEEKSIHRLEVITRITFMGFAASHFNKVLHPDHKFIFTIGYTDEENEYRFGFTTRELIRVFNNYIPERAVPFVHAETQENMIRGELARVKLLLSTEDLLDLSSDFSS